MTSFDAALAALRSQRATLTAAREAQLRIIRDTLAACDADGQRTPTVAETQRSEAAHAERVRIDAELATLAATIKPFEDEDAAQRADEEAQRHVHRAATLPDETYGQKGARAATWSREDGRPAALDRGQRMADHDVVRRIAATRAQSDQTALAQYGDLGQMVRALTTTGTSAIVPVTWASDLIDAARNHAAVLQAGATIVPMDAATVKIGRVTGDPAATFRTEGSAITPSDVSLDNVTLVSRTMSALVIGSIEWFQDAINSETVITDAIAKAIAQRLDLVSLYGGIESGAGSINLATPPNPRGVLAALNALNAGNILGDETDGTTQTEAGFYDEVIDTIFTVKDGNEEPTGLIWNSKTARAYAKATDTTGQPLALPSAVTEVPRYLSNQLPTYTKGSMTAAANDIFVGDWTQLLIGQRLDMSIQVLTERYADNGQIGIVAHWRGDVQPARLSAFAAYRAIKGA